MLFKDTGPQKLTVALIYGDATAALAPRYFLGTQAFDANFAVRYASQVFVLKAPGVSNAAALAAVRAVASRYSGTTSWTRRRLRRTGAKPIQQQLMLVDALLALAILIALLGIGNTLARSILERTRELGVLLDTIIVRSVLVTALNRDLGHRMWWPAKLARKPDPAPAELRQERATALTAD